MGFAVSPWLASGSLTFGFCFDLVTPHPSRRPTETQKNAPPTMAKRAPSLTVEGFEFPTSRGLSVGGAVGVPVGVVVWVAGGLGRIVGAAVVETGIGVGAKMGSAVGGAVTVGEKVRVMGNTGSSVVPGSVHISVSCPG